MLHSMYFSARNFLKELYKRNILVYITQFSAILSNQHLPVQTNVQFSKQENVLFKLHSKESYTFKTRPDK